MKKRILLITLSVIVVVIIGLLLFFNTNLYLSFLKSRIEKQMTGKYGLSFTVTDTDRPGAGVPDFGSPVGFTAVSGEGTFSCGECDWKGKVLKESYIHYHYAPKLNGELENLLSGCFEDCCIIRDCDRFGGNETVVDLVDTKEIADAEAYSASVDREKTYFRVYLKNDVTPEQLQNALDVLSAKGYRGNVYFMPVGDELFKELKASGIVCFYAKSSIAGRLSEYVKCIDQQEIDKLIYDTDTFIKAQYVPKWNAIEIIR